MSQAQKQRLIRVIVACKNAAFDVEREELARRVYPKLRDYAFATHGLEFQILDFSGPSPGRTDDETRQYLEQLYLCHEQTIGPGMIALIDGDEKDPASPRDSAFHHILNQAYFNYPESKRNRKSLFVIRSRANPHSMHDRKRKYRKQQPTPEPETLTDRLRRTTATQNVIDLVIHTNQHEKLDVEQSHYLQGFCDSVYQQMVQLIDENVNDFTNSNTESSLKPEMTQHWDYAQTISGNFARENVQDSIKKYLESESDQMYIVHGQNEQDLSSIIARVAWAVRDWTTGHGHHSKTTVVLRHIGLTLGSHLKTPLLRSICRQIRQRADEIPTSEQNHAQFHQIVHDGEYQGNLIVFLDGVHLLDTIDWLPKRLAGNVKFVISMVTKSVSMATIKRKCFDFRQYIEVPTLALSEQVESLDILHRTRYHQRLSKENISQFAQVLKQCDRSGYYTSMLIRFAENQRIPLITAFTTIKNIDACLENQICCVSMNHSSVLLHRTLGYLTASPAGLSALELSDILSLDNEVMKETKGTCTNNLPARFVCALLKDLEPLLIRLQIDGIEVYRFKDPAVQLYMMREYVDNPGLSKTVYSNMADYFLGVWNSHPKAFCDENYSKRQVQVPAQILVHNSETKFPTYNKRKLTLLPVLLAKCDRTVELKGLILYNFQWILTKIRALGVPDLVQDYALSKFTESGIVATALKESEPFLVQDDSILTIELSGRLLPYYNEYTEIRHLVNQCDEHSTRNGGLIPRLPLFVPPDTVIEKCGRIDNGPKYEHTLFRSTNIQLLSIRKAIGHIMIHDQELDEQICDFNVPDLYKTFLTPDGQYLISFTKNRQILMHSTMTGDQCMELPYTGDLVHDASLNGQFLSFTMVKSAGPHILDLSQGIMIHRLNLQSKVVSMSRGGEYLICDGSQRLNIYTLPLVRRLCTLDIKDAKSIIFAPRQGPTPKGPDFYTVTKTGDLYHVTIDLVCNIPTVKKIIRDVEMKEMKYSPNDEKYMVHCTRSVHVFDSASDEKLFVVKSLLPVDGNITFENVLFTDDSKWLVTVQGVHISVWNKEGKLVRMLDNPNQETITNAIVKYHHLFTLDSDNNAIKWDLNRVKNGTKPKANVHAGSVDRLAVISDKIVACYGDDTPEITLFNLDDGRKIRSLIPSEVSGCVVVHVGGSKNGEFIITVHAMAEAVFPTSEVVCEACLWRTKTGERLFSSDATEYAGFSPQNDLAYFVRFTPEIGRDCVVYNTLTAKQKTLPLPPLTILAKPVVDSRYNLRLFTADMGGMDLLLWKISLQNENDYKSVYFTETYMINDIRPTDTDDVINILHTGGLITYDLALHQIMRKITFASSPETIYDSQYSMALDGRRLHDLNHARNERILRMRAAPNLVTFIVKDNYLAYISEEYDKLIIKGVQDGRRRAWCPLHGKGTSIALANDNRTVLVGCEDGRILSLTLVLDTKDSASLISSMASRAKGRPKTAQEVLKDDLDRVVLSSATRRIMSASSGKPAPSSRPGSSQPRPFSTMRCRPSSSPAIRLMDRPYTR